MKNIDFLPLRYRNRRLELRAKVWEYGVVAFFGVFVAAAALTQGLERRRIVADVQELSPALQRALDAQLTYQQRQTQLASASEAAELYLYLAHPWPRTQVLSAIQNALPEGAALTELHLTYEVQQIAAPPVDEAQQQKLSTWQRDLAHLRREADRRQALVWIAGETSDATLVYELAAELSKSPLFSTVKLETVENQLKGQTKQTTFRLRGVLKPGYGQPGGPGKPPVVTQSPTHVRQEQVAAFEPLDSETASKTLTLLDTHDAEWRSVKAGFMLSGMNRRSSLMKR